MHIEIHSTPAPTSIERDGNRIGLRFDGPDPEERQVAPTLDGIRKDHTARYMWACPYVRNRTVTDYGCGVGYGTSIMAASAALAVGVDCDGPAVDYAREHYASAGAGFVLDDALEAAQRSECAVAVAFEMIEHLEDPAPFLKAINADTLLASVPNEHVIPYHAGIKFHHRHYTPEQFETLLNDCGWQVVEWWGQETHESAPAPNIQGRTQIVVAHRSSTPKRDTWRNLPPPPDFRYNVTKWQHPTGRAPKSVHLVGLGPSKYALTEYMLQHDFEPAWDELWTINKGIDFVPHAHVAWIMDDVYDYATKHPAYGAGMRRYVENGGNIIGQTTIPNDGSIRFTQYPLQQVLEAWGGSAGNWLHTISVGYILAYAGYLGVERLFLTGIDCSWPNRPDLSEAGNAVVCYWVGRLEGAGCEVIISGESALNQTNQRGRYEWRKFYGYLKQPA